jgi:acyl carrier protein
MNTEQARVTVLSLIGEIAPDTEPEQLAPDVDLRRAADLDSLDFQNLVEAVARDTGVEIPEVDYAVVRTVNDLAQYVASHTQ